MGQLSAAAVLLAAIAGAMAFAPSPGPARLRAAYPQARNRSQPARGPGVAVSPWRRAVAACSAAVAVVVMVGGSAGWLLGVVAGGAAWIGVGRLEPVAAIRRRQRIAGALPLAAELLAAAVAAGAPPDRAAQAVGEAIGGPLGQALSEAAAATRVGADPEHAWRGLLGDPVARPLARAMLRAVARGASPVGALDRVARDARDAARWAAEAKARSVGASAAVPLGLCFLPAFVLIGIVPLVATLGMPLLP